MRSIPTPLLLALALVGASGPGQAQLNADVYTRSASRAEVGDRITGVGAAQVQRTANEPSGGARTSLLDGTASAEMQTLKARADLRIDSTSPGNFADAKTTSSFDKTLFLDPALLGLTAGDPYRLKVPIWFDGSSIAGSITGGGSSFSYTSTDVSLRYKVIDLDELVPVEGGWRPKQVMSFGYSARIIYDSRFDASTRAGWSGSSNVTPLIEGGLADGYLPTVPTTGSIALPVDTGPLLFYVDTKVGHRLQITASLDVFVQVEASLGTGYAAGSFQNTFDAGALGMNPGDRFAGETPGVFGVSPVPEGGTAAMWLAGLLLLAARRRPAGPA